MQVEGWDYPREDPDENCVCRNCWHVWSNDDDTFWLCGREKPYKYRTWSEVFGLEVDPDGWCDLFTEDNETYPLKREADE